MNWAPPGTVPFGPLEQFVAARVGIDPKMAFVCGRTRPRLVTDTTLAEMVGSYRRQVFRWRRTGVLRVRRANEIAVFLGVNPCTIWPDYHDRCAA